MIEQDIHRLKFYSVDNYLVDMKSYVNRKILLVTINASSIDMAYLKSLDSLNRSGQISVIGICIKDFGVPVDSATLLKTIVQLNLSFPLTKISNGRRVAGQHILMRWINTLTTKNHFGQDIDFVDKGYFIGSSGLLYGVVTQKVRTSDLVVQTALNSDRLD